MFHSGMHGCMDLTEQEMLRNADVTLTPGTMLGLWSVK